MTDNFFESSVCLTCSPANRLGKFSAKTSLRKDPVRTASRDS